MAEPIECLSCYEEFEQRADAPDLRVCPQCEPNAKDMDDTRCPKCGWDSQSVECNDEAPVKIKNYLPDFNTGYCGGAHWDEEWTCPLCSTVFEFDNGSV